MRNYVKVLILHTLLGTWDYSVSPPLFVDQFYADFVGKKEAPLQDQLNEFIAQRDANLAPWRTIIADQELQDRWVKLNKNNLITILVQITELSTITLLPKLERVLAHESPRDTWSHGH
jgi:hypothetical protein